MAAPPSKLSLLVVRLSETDDPFFQSAGSPKREEGAKTRTLFCPATRVGGGASENEKLRTRARRTEKSSATSLHADAVLARRDLSKEVPLEKRAAA
mmetsp:Transcript_64517/g.153881  ORF Transcript_64517/g.153881 Transcript_64517/m.153881 type:complete len:96 (-) Transcript_64517:563-850(-)